MVQMEAISVAKCGLKGLISPQAKLLFFVSSSGSFGAIMCMAEHRMGLD